MSGPPTTLSPKARRNALIILVLALIADTVTYGLVMPFLPLHVASLGVGETGTGLLFGSYAAAMLAVLIPLIWKAQRFKAQTLLVGGLVCLTFATGMFALSGAWLPGLFIARALQGASAAVSWVGAPAVVACLYPSQERGAAMGWVMTGTAVGTLLGPPVGGALYDWGGFVAPFAAVLALCMVMIPCVVWALRRLPPMPESQDLPLQELVRLPGMTKVLALTAIATSVLALLEPALPMVMTALYETNALENGLLVGLVVLAFGVVSPLAGRLSDRWGRFRMMGVGYIGLAAMMPLTVAVPGLAWAAVCIALCGPALAFSLSACMPAMADLFEPLPEERRDYLKLYALYNIVYGLGMLCGPVFGGVLLDLFEPLIALGTVGACCLIVGLWLSWTSRATAPS